METEFLTPLALRYWPVYDASQETSAPGQHKRRRKAPGRRTWIGERVLFVTTRVSADGHETFQFGHFLLFVRGVKRLEGVFIADALKEADPEGFAAAQEFARREGICFFTRRDFVIDVLYVEAWHLGAVLVGFDLPFHLARIAEHASISEGRNRDAFSIKLTGLPSCPDIRIRPLTACSAFIEFLRPAAKGSRRAWAQPYAGRFLDLRTLLYALTGEATQLSRALHLLSVRPSLSAACAESRCVAIGPAVVGHAREDAWASFRLYVRLRDLYSELPFSTCQPETVRDPSDTPITALYSAASVAKGFLRKMGIRPNRTSVPDKYHGYAMAAFYGGWQEVRIRRVALPTVLLDFTSQYPAVFTLLDLWPLMAAQRIYCDEWEPAETEHLLSVIASDPDLLFDPLTWLKLAGYALVEPQGHLLPSRAPWGAGAEGDLANVNLSIAPLTSDEPMWFALPDLARCAAVTGRHPKVRRAFRLRPGKPQRGVRPVAYGAAQLDPGDRRFFARVIEERKRLEREDQQALAWGAKMLANSGCSGILVEFNRNMLATKETRRRAIVHSEQPTRTSMVGQIEEPGAFTNPVVGALVTAGGRLLLGMLQREVEMRGGRFLWAATDALAVEVSDCPAAGASGGAARGVTGAGLSEVQRKFGTLCPFNAEAVPCFLDEKSSGSGYAIATNRFCLRKANGDFQPASQHGMGGIVPPVGKKLTAFTCEVWHAVLTGAIPEEWERQPLRRTLPLRKPEALRQIRRGNGPARAAVPFQVLETRTPVANIRCDTGQALTVIGLHEPDRVSSATAQWWDRATGDAVAVRPQPGMPGMVPAAGEVYCETLADFIRTYAVQVDQKMAGLDNKPCRPYTIGELHPRPVVRKAAYLIGKEADRIAGPLVYDAADKPDVIGPSEARPRGALARERAGRRRTPTPDLLRMVEFLGSLPPSAVATELLISREQWWRLRNGRQCPSERMIERIRALFVALNCTQQPMPHDHLVAWEGKDGETG